MKDSTCICDEFAEEIKHLFFEHKPKRIIETGAYLGQGSTEIITSLIRDIPIENAEFHSIEVGKEHIETAVKNLSSKNLNQYVKFHWGLSIPQELLPTNEETDLRMKGLTGIFHDHPEGKEGENYSIETNKFEEDNLFEKVLDSLSKHPDFILLDSAGHLGFTEFLHVMSLLTKPCFIAIDDVDHVKHYETFSYASKSDLFEVIKRGREKYGYAILKYKPK